MTVIPRLLRERRLSALAAALVLLTAAAVVADRPEALSDLPVLPWWVFGALFALTHSWAIPVRVRGSRVSMSMNEIPLVMGLFLTEPSSLLAGRLVGAALAVAVRYRRLPASAAGSVATAVGGTAAGLLVFIAAVARGDPLGVHGWVAVLTAAAVSGIVSVLAGALARAWAGTPQPAVRVVRAVLAGMATPAPGALVGFVPVLALSRGAAELPLAVTGVALLLGCRAYTGLITRHAGLAQLYELSDALAASSASTEAVESVLRHGARLMRAKHAELVLAGAQPGRTFRWVLAPDGVAGPAEVDAGLDRVPFRAAATLGGRGASAPERDFLAERGVRRAAVVPLRVDESVSGHLLVADRLGEDRRFSADDVRMLQAAANHTSLALRTTRLIDRLHAESRHDELTGLPNRLAFRELLDETAGAAAGGGAGCAVMVLDFDGFKAINDTLGHLAGDELLRVLAHRLRTVAADDAVVARLGGDEFAVLTTRCCGAQEARELAARLLRVFDEPVSVAGTRLRLGGSLGIALGPRHGRTGSELLRTADIAMYAAKSSSGGIRMFGPDLVPPPVGDAVLAAELREAIDRDAIAVAVQPLLDLTSGALHSVEVLARWTHPRLGEVAPRDVVEAAERGGHVAAFSARILDRALRLCAGWQHRQPVPVAVNLATGWLGDPGLPEQVEAALTRHGVPAEMLCLELTEAGVIAEPRRAIQTLGRVRELGVRLSVDDFGTGYSSLSFLSRLPVQQIKIDSSFVQRAGASAGDRAIVKSVLDLGRNLDLEVVAEGVADSATLALLQQLGCRLGQGFLLGRPVPPEQLAAHVLAGVAGSIPHRGVPSPATP